MMIFNPNNRQEPVNYLLHKCLAVFFIFMAAGLLWYAWGVLESDFGIYVLQILMTLIAFLSVIMSVILLKKSQTDIGFEQYANRKCPFCSYDIRYLPENRCPECGEKWESK